MTARSWFWAVTLVYAAVLVWAWTVLPDRVPVHWSGSDGPDRVVGRDRAVVEFGLVGAAMVLFFAALAGGMPRMPMTMVNVPHKEYWSREEHQPEVRRRLAADMWFFGAVVLGFLTLSVLQIVRVADAPEPRLGPLFWVAFVGVVVLSLGYASAATTWRYRPDQEGT